MIIIILIINEIVLILVIGTIINNILIIINIVIITFTIYYCGFHPDSILALQEHVSMRFSGKRKNIDV